MMQGEKGVGSDARGEGVGSDARGRVGGVMQGGGWGE